MKLKYHIFRFGILKRLHFGDRLMVFPSFRCPVQCTYCSLRYASLDEKNSMVTTKHADELSMTEWQRLILNFPKKIREIQVSGGEPFTWPHYSEFVNWALDRGYFVSTFSSLWNLKGLGVRESLKYRIIATHHVNVPKETFDTNLIEYQKKYRIDVEEIETSFSTDSLKKPLCYNDYSNTCVGFMHGPDGKLFYTFWHLVDHYANENRYGMMQEGFEEPLKERMEI